MAPGNIRIWWDPDLGAYRMITPYSKPFLDLFKAALPASERSWNDSNKTWSFMERHLAGVVRLTEQVFGGKATVITKQQAESAQTPATVTASPLDKIIVQFFKLLPYEAARKAYLFGSQSLHPDKGGDLDKMTAFNAAWQRLEKDLYGKN